MRDTIIVHAVQGETGKRVPVRLELRFPHDNLEIVLGLEQITQLKHALDYASLDKTTTVVVL